MENPFKIKEIGVVPNSKLKTETIILLQNQMKELKVNDGKCVTVPLDYFGRGMLYNHVSKITNILRTQDEFKGCKFTIHLHKELKTPVEYRIFRIS